jgi:hypothetical protein
MFSLRSKSESARIASAVALLLSVSALLVFPAAAAAAPEGGEEPPAPELAFEPASFDFGQVRLNGSTNQATMQLRNVGSVATQVFSFSVSGGNGTFGIGPTDCIRTLNPGETCSLQVYFGPYDATPFAAQLHAYAEAGVVVTADLSGEGGRPVLEPDVNPVNFGSVPVGSGGVTKSIDVTNNGNMAGGAFIAVISGGAVGSFHLVDENCTGILITPGATCNLQVSFEPLGIGSKTARLSLFGEEEGGTQIVLSGVGLEPEPEASESSSQSGLPVTASKPRTKHGGRSKPRRGSGLHRRLRLNLASRQAIG